MPPVALPAPEARPRARGVRRLRNRLVAVVLPLSLALNVILIGFAWSDATVPQPFSAVRTVPRNAPTVPRKVVGTVPVAPASPRPKGTPTKSASVPKERGRAARASAAARARRGAVERKLLTLIVRSPAGKLPPALIDSKTGLAKNGLQAVCRSSSGSRSFLCLIQPARHKPGEGLYARYRLKRNGTGGTFTWYPYRNG